MKLNSSNALRLRYLHIERLALPGSLSTMRDFLKARCAIGTVGRNGLFAAMQSVFVTCCFFVVYRLVIAQVGLERLGIWSLMLAGSAAVRVGDVSGGGALARFVAIGQFGDARRTRDTIHTVMLTSLIFNSLLALAIAMAAPYLLPQFVQPAYLSEARALIPAVSAVMLIGGLAVAATSGIDGAQRADQRAIVVVFSAIVFLSATWVLVPRFGVIGFGVAQVLQQVSMLVAGWAVLRRHVEHLGWFPIHWRKDVFVETTGYGLKLNAIGVMVMLFEPLIKFCFNHAGGPGAVALYELASRLVTQIRGLVTSAAMPLVPAFAARMGSNDATFKPMLGKATAAAAVASIGVCFATLAIAPIASVLVLGRVSPEMLNLNAALAVGWCLNLPCLAFYFAGQAAGIMRWNFIGHAAQALSVLVGAYLLVPIFGLSGLILSVVVGLTLSMLASLLGNAYALEGMVIVKGRVLLIIASASAVLLMYGANRIITSYFL